jgi:peptidoglycan lytic transglycosylase
MYSDCCAEFLCFDFRTDRFQFGASQVPVNGIGKVVRLLTAVAAAAMLAACAQSSSVATSNFGSPGAGQQQASSHPRRVASLARHTPFAHHRSTDRKSVGSQGLASFYTEGTETASGEKFDTNELTAAHPTLPFGTKLRVTNVATGRSVTVRVNDRGPYVPGRIVDVSYSAADALGMVHKGVTNVKIDVVH